jgi:hypothetical protein
MTILFVNVVLILLTVIVIIVHTKIVKGREKMHRHIIHKLDKKIERVRPVHEIGVKTMGQAARRLEILDKVLQLFGMRVGAYQTADLDIQGDVIMGVRLTVYFVR